jgi:hypothetical protein
MWENLTKEKYFNDRPLEEWKGNKLQVFKMGGRD